ncbi:heavy metal-binding domain-containing protein [Cyanobium sp. NIES-981]|uniref:heavy metal-binding domain-containing protein n=1 Tax=Cyanobium sp. NIES-981 TaxID=1851505 RepID=UPI0007DD59CF|nr:heavy metal-binding domain-containing protein [Cyanobium sp. NIES-981]SBO44396.1 conserved hypothetical protein [Cyanobium sp. NIES-981]
MLITTTPSLEGQTIQHYLGPVHGEAILGANIFRDLLASVRDVVGGRARAYEKALQQARQEAMEELARRAELLGADAVVGLQLDTEVLGQSGGMLMVCAVGTAVRLEEAGRGRALPLPPPPLPPQA